ncbi:inositol-3-phosphate synthase [Streptomyces xiaopingdaonensis]|uniref:inositol-3-phosphate synthase n=1 Tax=Streptomyces xiaopingdaonensis TaxID=1565415 RepID=UPI00031C6950|nr:inositol-3-phosphate synthase [Streptomyces xiaopingdaonensis]
MTDTRHNPTTSRERTGVWLVGARGSVATTAVAGCAAVTAGLHPPAGMVTEAGPFTGSGLPALDTLVFGGHETACGSLGKRAEELADAGVLPHGLPAAVRGELERADAAVRTASPHGAHAGDEAAVEQLASDIREFGEVHEVARTVVVNVASTEAAPEDDPAAPLPPSSRYAAAALRAGCPYVNFTPSTGLHHPRLAAPARESGLPYAGRDGKTGQTLLRSVLAPMFAQRALAVRAWSGTNLLGGGDGAALAEPGAAAVKNAGKERVLGDTLGELPDGEVHIDNTPAMGEWKTAWDHIAFDGFLGARMYLQTTWQGCDSALAAPLVLDLARIAARAHESGLTGPIEGLGFYFKDPDEGSAALPDQWRALLHLADRLGERR